MYYTFQESLIWDGAGGVDPNGAVVTKKGKTEASARKRLSKTSSLGRTWVLIGTK